MAATRLSDTLNETYSEDFFSAEFQNTLEYHIPLIVGLQTTQVLSLKSGVSLQYDGDLFALLTASGVPAKYHWATMRCNNMTSPNDYRKSMTSILIPGFDYIDELFSIYQSTNNISYG